MRVKTRATLLALTVLAASALTSCDTYPSGCVRIPPAEIPKPYAWEQSTQAVWWFHDGGLQTFVGVAGGFPQDGHWTWHGATHFNGQGYAEYLSAWRCWKTNGASSWPWW